MMVRKACTPTLPVENWMIRRVIVVLEQIGDGLEARVVEHPGSIPPSISIVVPLMKSAAPEARNTHVRPTSAGSPPRRKGMSAKYRLPSGSSLGSTNDRKFSVMVGPSATQLTRTAGPHSWASERVRWLRPAFAAPYDTSVGEPAGCPAPLETLMMQPVPSRVFICRYARMANHNGLIRFICTANA
jgi:hypothetical protein